MSQHVQSAPGRMSSLLVGPVGRLLALALTASVLGLVWLAVVQPLVGLYQDRADGLAQRRILLGHMAARAAKVPRLRAQSAVQGPAAPAAALLLGGVSDAIAGAALQERIQAIAGRAGLTLASTETLPAVAAGSYRRIGLRVAFSAPWPALVRLLQSVEEASPRMLTDELQLRGPRVLGGPGEPVLEASLTVLAFRTAAAPAAGRAATAASPPGGR